jgi:hypothetical protein
MAELEVGDILHWDRDHPEFHEVVASGHSESGPLVMTRPNGAYHCYCKQLNGLPFYKDGTMELSWLRYRFRKDEFLTAAKKACQDE